MPKRSPLVWLFLAVLLVLPAALLSGLEIRGSFRLENTGFAPSRPASDVTFAGTDFFWEGSLTVEQPVMDAFLVQGGVSRDLILGNTAYSVFQFRTDYFGLGIGTFLGFLNSPSSSLKPGLIAIARLEIPGIVYLSARADGLPSGGTGGAGDYTQEQSEVALGLYLHNALLTTGVSYKMFELFTTAGSTTDALADYFLRTEIFEKNIPLRLLLSISYQTLSRVYLEGGASVTDGLGSFILGTGFGLELGGGFTMYLNMESCLFTTGSGQLAALSIIGFQPFLFKAGAGFVLNIPTSSP